MKDAKKKLPPPNELIEYDLILFSRRRLEQEYVEATFDRWTGDKIHEDGCCIYLTGFRHCTCGHSPLLDIHFKRIITDEGHFLLLANRLYSQRVGNNDKFYHAERMPLQTSHINHRQGQGTSSIGAQHSYTLTTITNPQFSQGTTLAPVNGPYVTAEMIKEELATFCRDSEKLQNFYDEVTARTAIPMTPLVTGLIVHSAVMRAAIGGNLESVPSSPAMLALGGSTFSPATTTAASVMGRVSSVSAKSGRSSLKSSDTSGTE